jgi:hypothetical protein
VISDVAEENRNSRLFDASMLKTVAGYDRARRNGLTTMRFALPHRSSKESVVDKRIIDLARQLQSETPRPQRVRIMGKLDGLYDEDQSFVLQLVEGQRLRGAWMKDSPEPLRDLWGKDVLIEGLVQSGAFQRRCQCGGLMVARLPSASNSIVRRQQSSGSRNVAARSGHSIRQR